VLTPLFSVFFSVLILGDALDGRMVAGGLLTLSGVTVILARERRGAAAGT
jgi:O-acetylserine/cysteine efflux transporter